MRMFSERNERQKKKKKKEGSTGLLIVSIVHGATTRCCSHLHARVSMKVRHAAGLYRARRERSLFCSLFRATSIAGHEDQYGVNTK